MAESSAMTDQESFAVTSSFSWSSSHLWYPVLSKHFLSIATMTLITLIDSGFGAQSIINYNDCGWGFAASQWCNIIQKVCKYLLIQCTYANSPLLTLNQVNMTITSKTMPHTSANEIMAWNWGDLSSGLNFTFCAGMITPWLLGGNQEILHKRTLYA